MTEGKDFWSKLDKLVASHTLIVDRPKGSSHPRYPSFFYPFDYGYLADTISGDGNGIDIWVGSLQGKQVTAVICCVDLEKRDLEIKILLGCTLQESEEISQIHNTGSQSAILWLRSDDI